MSVLLAGPFHPFGSSVVAGIFLGWQQEMAAQVTGSPLDFAMLMQLYADVCPVSSSAG